MGNSNENDLNYSINLENKENNSMILIEPTQFVWTHYDSKNSLQYQYRIIYYIDPLNYRIYINNNNIGFDFTKVTNCISGTDIIKKLYMFCWYLIENHYVLSVDTDKAYVTFYSFEYKKETLYFIKLSYDSCYSMTILNKNDADKIFSRILSRVNNFHVEFESPIIDYDQFVRLYKNNDLSAFINEL